MTDVSPSPDDIARLNQPATIGRYRIIRPLGEGGMGTVYEAEQDQPHRKVALKVIRSDFLNPELIRRFTRESEVLGRLQHPGIAQVYEAGTADTPRGPQPFFAMELVKGDSLDAYVHNQKLTLEQRLTLFIKICEAVEYAHQQGVVHRDIKPANILVDPTGQPRILDFGVARLSDPDNQATRQTSTGQLVGTLQYMSPEQINGDPREIDARSDVYSLGVLLYELLSERLPYDVSRLMLHEAAFVILQVDPAPLSSINRHLRGDLETIVGRALEKEKGRRYPTADALASDVRHFLQHEPITARPASAMYQLVKFARRNRALVGGLSLAALILVIGTVVSVLQAVRATKAEHLAEARRAEAEASGKLAEQRRAEASAALLVADSARADALREQTAATASAKQARNEASKAQAVNSFLQEMLASASPTRSRGKELTVREVLDQTMAGGGANKVSRQPEVQAAVDATIGRTYSALGLFEQARPHMDSAYALRRRALGSRDLETARSASDRASLFLQTGKYPEAEQAFKESLAIKRAQLAPDDDEITMDLSALGEVTYKLGRYPEAERLYREALRLSQQRHGSDGVETAQRLQSLGNFLAYTNRDGEAEPFLLKALELRRKTLPADDPDIVNSLIAVGNVKAARFDYKGAEQLIREALASAHTIYGTEHPVIANLTGRLGDVLSKQHRVEEAEPILREALAMRIKLLGANHPDVQLARGYVSDLLIQQGKLADADTLLQQVLAARREVLGPDNPAVASAINDIGRLYERSSRWADAERMYREAIPIWQASRIADQETSTQAQLGWVLSRQNRPDEAEPILEDVLVKRRAMFGENHRLTGDAYEKLAGVAMARGNIARAESLTVKGLAVRKAIFGPQAIEVAEQLLNVAFLREAINDTAGAVPVMREAAAIYARTRPATDPNVLGSQQWLAIELCTTGKVEEGKALLASAIALVPLDSTKTTPWRLRGSMGFCLTKEGKYAEAEPLLLQAESGLRGVKGVLPVHLQTAVTRLVSLYQAWGKPEKVEEWRGRR